MLGDALSFPRQGEDSLKTILIGGVLTILGAFLVIPAIPVNGFLVRVTAAGVRGESEPPVFDDWGKLFVDGILFIVVALAYIAVPFLLIVVGTLVFAGGAAVFANDGGALGAGLGVVGGLFFLVAMGLLFLAIYLLPAAVANFAHEDELGAAFDFGRVLDGAISGDYFVSVLLAIAVGLTLGFVAAILTVLLVGIFLAFYVQMVTYYLLGRGFGGGLGIEPGGDSGESSDGGGADGDTGGSGSEDTGDDRIPDPDPLT